MPAWIYVVAVAAVLTVAWYGWARRWLHSWRYSWARAAHAVDLTIGEPVPGAEYGSMILDAERGWVAPLSVMLAAPVDPEPWRARMTAELSPEALDPDWDSFPCGGACGDTYAHTFCAPPDEWPEPADPGAGDNGIGVVSSAPAPDPDWLKAQMAVLFDWSREARVRLAAI